MTKFLWYGKTNQKLLFYFEKSKISKNTAVLLWNI